MKESTFFEILHHNSIGHETWSNLMGKKAIHINKVVSILTIEPKHDSKINLKIMHDTFLTCNWF